jgi:hypothetical protein
MTQPADHHSPPTDHTEHPPATQPAEQPTVQSAEQPAGQSTVFPVTLGDVAPGREQRHLPVVTADGDTVVARDWADSPELQPGLIQVWSERHHVTHYPASTPVTPVTDPARAARVLRQALTQQVEHTHAVQVTAKYDAGQHHRQLSEIRNYAIDRHLEGSFCRDGLNAFLTTFGLARFEPCIRVDYTVTGSYDVDPDEVERDPDLARRDAEESISPDLHNVVPFLTGSDSYDVEATATLIREP